MPRVIVCPASSEMAGVNTRTGVTGEPAPVYAMVTEAKVVTERTMAGATGVFVEAVTSPDDAIEKVPALAAFPRVKPDSVMTTAPVVVGLPPMTITTVVEVWEPELPVIPAILDAPAINEGEPVK